MCLHSEAASVVNFGATPTELPVTLRNATASQGNGTTALQFRVVQALKGEEAFPDGDVMMLVNLPIQYKDQNTAGKPLTNVDGAIGQPAKNPVLIRNFAFASSADANISQMKSWRIEVDDFTFGNMLGFWVSGGHFDNPRLALYGEQPDEGHSLVS